MECSSTPWRCSAARMERRPTPPGDLDAGYSIERDPSSTARRSTRWCNSAVQDGAATDAPRMDGHDIGGDLATHRVLLDALAQLDGQDGAATDATEVTSIPAPGRA